MASAPSNVLEVWRFTRLEDVKFRFTALFLCILLTQRKQRAVGQGNEIHVGAKAAGKEQMFYSLHDTQKPT